jgi:putative methionine-R-sulfoxide reductase with GAF domain
MRFFVQVTPIGKAETQTYCVEADSWQKALQAARALRKENSPISGFSIELTDDGCRAIDPTARLRYVVKKAPPNAALTTVDGVPLSKEPSVVATQKSAAKPTVSAARASNRPPAGAIGNGAGAVAMRSESKIAVAAAGAGGSMAAAAAVVPDAPRTVPSLPPDDATHVLYRREEEPSAKSPLYYREDVYVMPEGTSEADAERYLRQQLTAIQAALSSVRQGKYVNLAVFDRVFEGRPPVPPLCTLSWKDWKGNEATVSYPRRGGVTAPAPILPTQPSAGVRQSGVHDSASRMLAATAASATASVGPRGGPSPSIAAIGEALKRASQPPPPPASNPEPIALVTPASATPPPPAGILALGQAIERATSQPPPPPDAIQPAPVVAAVPRPASVPPPEPAESIIVAGPAQTIVDNRPPSVIPPAPIPAAGMPSSRPPPPLTGGVPSEPRQRISEGLMRISQGRQRAASRPSFTDGRQVRGDELIAVLFEAMHDLHFARDTLEAASFCLHLAMEMIPSRAAFAHFYDIDKREYVLVATAGAGTDPLILKRHPPTDPLLGAAMRNRAAVVVPDATKNDDAFVERFELVGGAKSIIVTPVMAGGRALAAIEIVNPVDGNPFNEAEGNAFTYMGEQFAEYVSSHGLVLDTERIKRTTPG